MAEVIGVRFKDGGKVYYFDPGELQPQTGDAVIVETARGVECGVVANGSREVTEEEIVKPLKRVMRMATKKDIAQMEENRRREKSAFEICQKKILEHKMEMKLVDVEYSFDNSKLLFYFTADGRVDFRDLVKDLAGIFRTRIDLRQIGVRDEAKMLGGLGICGRPFCCSSFLHDFQPVSIKMAKEQGLSLNPTKISGTCGRLMCCLKYEQDAYTDLIKTTPRQGAVVETPEGRGTVVEIVNLVTGKLRVRLDVGENNVKVFYNRELLSPTPAARPAKSEVSEEFDKPSNEAAPAAVRNEAKPAGQRPAEPSTPKAARPPRPPRQPRPAEPIGSEETPDNAAKREPMGAGAPKKPRRPQNNRPRRPRNPQSNAPAAGAPQPKQNPAGGNRPAGEKPVNGGNAAPNPNPNRKPGEKTNRPPRKPQPPREKKPTAE